MGPRVAVAVLSLAAVPIDGGTVRADGSAPVLRLVWFDPSEIASGSESVARAETATLLARMGATVQWRRGTLGEVDRNDGVWVILVGEGPPEPGEAVLGASRKGHSAARVVWVRVPNVQAAIGISRSRSLLGLRPDEQRRLAVALGRVIAHEVVHAVVPCVPHGTGLMSGGLSRRQLTAASISVELDAALALQDALQNNHLVVPLGAGLLAADARARGAGRPAGEGLRQGLGERSDEGQPPARAALPRPSPERRASPPHGRRL